MPVEPEAFRHVLRHVPTSVTVVSGMVGGVPMGLSVGSFVPVSLEPPLVGFFVAETSATWPKILPTETFCVSVLAEDQARLSRRFAVSSTVTDKFEGVDWHCSPAGLPVLDGAVAWVDCRLHNAHEAGDHLLVLGLVEDLGVGSGSAPLVHHLGGYRRPHDLDPLV